MISRVQSISLVPPSLKDNTGDADRLVIALKKKLQTNDVHIDLDILKELPIVLRQGDYKLRVMCFKDRRGWTVAGIAPSENQRPMLGLAIDLGTTRIVLRLIDLATGETAGQTGLDNPQIPIGPDILARIHFAETPGGLEKLSQIVVDGINETLAALCETNQVTPRDIYLVSMAGNTAMTHLFLGLPPRWIIREPYIPVVNKPAVMKTRELGLAVRSSARILIFPNIGSYFGGDLIAGILYSEMNKKAATSILVDVGTNAEVVLGNDNWLIACAGAAGPALEGGVTKMGMMAGPGVIDKVSIDPATRAFNIHTIGDHRPRGICGSGLIDLAAHLFSAGMVDIRGRLIPAECGDKLKTIDGVRYLVIVPKQESATSEDLTLSQIDLDSLIRSKAAMYTILETITQTVGITFDDISKFYVAGTFGAFIAPRSAITIGMIPDLSLDRFETLGNSSLEGAAKALMMVDCLAEIDRIRDGITYLELNVNQDFMNRFSAAKFIPHTDHARFPSVRMPK